MNWLLNFSSIFRRKYFALAVAFVLTACVRVILTGDRDILALNQPYDDYWFVSRALHWIYGGHYDHMAFAQLPVYSIWLKCVSLFGIPARLAIDFAWVITSAYLGFAVAKLLKSVWPGVVVYAFLAFHPYGIVLFDRALSENLMVVLSALALAGFIELWNLRDVPRTRDGRRILAVAVTAVAFAAAYHIRKEGIVLLPAVALLALLSAFKREVFWVGESRYRLGYPMLVAPIVATIILGTVLAGANYLRWGVFARYELAAPGYTQAINALIEIDPLAPTPKYVTVTAQTRARAYAQSPTFSELKPYLDGPMGQEVARYSSAFSGVPGEIANGWFYWTIRDAAAAAGWHVNARVAEKKYKAMAQELQDGFDSGKLPRRHVVLPFVDPDMKKWLPDFPKALQGEIRQLIDPSVASLTYTPAENATAVQYDRYLTLVGRRSPSGSFSIVGWVTLPEGTWIGLGNNDSVYSWQVLEGPVRPDVPGAISFSLNSMNKEIPTEIWLRLTSGSKIKVALINLREGMMLAIPDLPGSNMGIDRISNNVKKHRADAFIVPMTKLWSWLGWLLLSAAFFSFWGMRGRDAVKSSVIPTAAVLLLIAIFSRVFLLALLDASSWSGQQTRYLLPVLPFFAVFGTLGVWSIQQHLVQAKRFILNPR